MEFRFNLSPLFKTEIIRVKDNLLPQGYTGDKRTMLDGVAKMSEVLNDIGEASAQAQGLTKPVTTAQKLRNSDHTVYLLAENNGKNGVVTGLLKVGPKNLYVFDPNGETKMVNAPCVLDFYIHESRQRAGLGKKLFETMLEEEQCAPHKMAIDRPSDKLMGFLRKHYGLEHTIPQMNNFVVYDGFFEQQKNAEPENSHRMHITSSPNTALFGPHVQSGDGQNGKRSYMRSQQGSPLPCHNNQAAHGRYAAARPVCSMAEIINGGASHVATEPNRHL